MRSGATPALINRTVSVDRPPDAVLAKGGPLSLRGRVGKLARIVEIGPIPAVHGVVRCRLIDLMQWVWEEFRGSIAKGLLRIYCSKIQFFGLMV